MGLEERLGVAPATPKGKAGMEMNRGTQPLENGVRGNCDTYASPLIPARLSLNIAVQTGVAMSMVQRCKSVLAGTTTNLIVW